MNNVVKYKNCEINTSDIFARMNYKLINNDFDDIVSVDESRRVFSDCLKEYLLEKLASVGVYLGNGASIFEIFKKMNECVDPEQEDDGLSHVIHYLLAVTGVSPLWEVRDDLKRDEFSLVVDNGVLKYLVTGKRTDMYSVFCFMYTHVLGRFALYGECKLEYTGEHLLEKKNM